MRWVLLAIALLTAGSLLAAICSSQPKDHARAHHPYEPFTVEIAVKDR